MKKSLIFASILATAVSAAAVAQDSPAATPENPILKMYPENVMFYLSFNQGDAVADMANGESDPAVINKKTPEFEEKGFIGKAMKAGNIRYKAAQNIDLSVPGTLIVWVTPTWEQTKPANGKEPGFSVIDVAGDAQGYSYQLIVGKMGGQPWCKAPMNTYVQYTPNAKYPHVNCIVGGKSSAAKWPKGEWHMLATTWSAGRFTNSVNGQDFASSTLKTLTNGVTKRLDVYCGGPVIVDEVVVLNKELSKEELAKVYTDTMAVVNPQAAK